MLGLKVTPTICITVTSTVAAATLVYCTVIKYYIPQRRLWRVRSKLPKSLAEWREPGKGVEPCEQIWRDLEETWRKAGYTPWTYATSYWLISPGSGTYPVSNGYSYATIAREKAEPGAVKYLRRFEYTNPVQRPMRTPEGYDVIVRLIVLNDEGHEHLNILRKLTQGEVGVWHNNHTLPMVSEFSPFENVVFGIFPKVGGQVLEAYYFWAKNSAGDVVEMIMQMLEALEFIHSQNIAHRDAFIGNFVVQWHPESLLKMEISPSRPRVYIIDFEVAIMFPEGCPEEEKVSTGYPLGGTFTNIETYSRPLAPECTSGKPYSPFKMDVWQLGTSISNFKTTIPEIDDILLSLRAPDQKDRPSAREALARLRKAVYSMTPESLLIKPWFVNHK